jgi:hypothetical protein
MNRKLKLTVAAFMSAMAAFSPAQKAAVAAPETNQTVNANKDAVVKLKEEKMSVTRVNDMGGIDFDPTRIAYVNPIFEPRKHTVQTYRSQQRAAKARRKSRK